MLQDMDVVILDNVPDGLAAQHGVRPEHGDAAAIQPRCCLVGRRTICRLVGLREDSTGDDPGAHVQQRFQPLRQEFSLQVVDLVVELGLQLLPVQVELPQRGHSALNRWREMAHLKPIQKCLIMELFILRDETK